ncbi:MAG: ATP-binding cassette domain-containing protein [Rhodospirillales bacterium]|nr:ATP-binding cassette domain-containing protein [Rhodospirillales bacterium]
MALTPILVADDLHRFHHVADAEVRALRGASLTIGPGETVALVGPSGSGKSTFLACVAGLDDPDGGSVDVAGERMSRRPQAERAALRARSVGYLAQSGNLLAQYTVGENVALQLRLRVGASRPACSYFARP